MVSRHVEGNRDWDDDWMVPDAGEGTCMIGCQAFVVPCGCLAWPIVGYIASCFMVGSSVMAGDGRAARGEE